MSISAAVSIVTGLLEIDLSGIAVNDTITIGGTTYTAGGSGSGHFAVGTGPTADVTTASNLATAIVGSPPTGLVSASTTNPLAPLAAAQASVFIQGPFGTAQASGTIHSGNTGTWTVSAMASPNQKVNANVAVSNSGGSAVNVTALTPSIVPATNTSDPAPANLGQPPLLPGQPTSVAASGTSNFGLSLVANSPQIGLNPTNSQAPIVSQTYLAGASVLTSDGSVTTATTANLIVYPPTYV